MDHTFFPGYRRTLLSPEEILLSIEIPYSREVRCQELGYTVPKLFSLPDSRKGESALGTDTSTSPLQH